jgi:hypothetical protein
MSPQLTLLHTKLAQTNQNALIIGTEKKLTPLNLCRIILLGEMISASNRLRRLDLKLARRTEKRTTRKCPGSVARGDGREFISP